MSSDRLALLLCALVAVVALAGAYAVSRELRDVDPGRWCCAQHLDWPRTPAIEDWPPAAPERAEGPVTPT